MLKPGDLFVIKKPSESHWSSFIVIAVDRGEIVWGSDSVFSRAATFDALLVTGELITRTFSFLSYYTKVSE